MAHLYGGSKISRNSNNSNSCNSNSRNNNSNFGGSDLAGPPVTYDSHKCTKTIYIFYFRISSAATCGNSPPPSTTAALTETAMEETGSGGYSRWYSDCSDDEKRKDLTNKTRKCFVYGICRVSRRSIRIRRAKITAAIRYRVTRSVTASLPYPPPLLSLTSSPTKKEERRKGVEWKTPPTTSLLPPPSHKLKPYT